LVCAAPLPLSFFLPPPPLLFSRPVVFPIFFVTLLKRLSPFFVEAFFPVSPLSFLFLSEAFVCRCWFPFIFSTPPHLFFSFLSPVFPSASWPPRRSLFGNRKRFLFWFPSFFTLLLSPLLHFSMEKGFLPPFPLGGPVLTGVDLWLERGNNSCKTFSFFFPSPFPPSFLFNIPDRFLVSVMLFFFLLSFFSPLLLLFVFDIPPRYPPPQPVFFASRPLGDRKVTGPPSSTTREKFRLLLFPSFIVPPPVRSPSPPFFPAYNRPLFISQPRFRPRCFVSGTDFVPRCGPLTPVRFFCPPEAKTLLPRRLFFVFPWPAPPLPYDPSSLPLPPFLTSFLPFPISSPAVIEASSSPHGSQGPFP